MSGIFGIFNRHHQPVTIGAFHAMREALSYWNPDDVGEWCEGSVALGHTMLWNTPESKYEHLPLQTENYVLTMDARIDNREELSRELVLPDRPMEEIGDSEFVLAAYVKWGEECPKYLLGDFAFAIWDTQKQHLFCARDPIGIKPFYYYSDDEKFIFTSDIRGLLANSDIPQSIDDEAVAMYLTLGELWHPTMTFFSSIQKLPPATTMTLTSRTMSQNVYWSAEASPAIEFNSLDEYAKALRALILDAVHKRVRSSQPIVSHLSGGLDSSTIAVIASRHLKTQQRKLHAYNWVPSPKENEDVELYEWANSREISTIENIHHSYIELNPDNLAHIWRNRDIALGDTVDLWYESLVRNEAQKINARVILSGWGGDELITYSGRAATTEMLYRGDVFKAIRTIYQRHHAAPNKWRRILGNSYHQLILPFLPESFYRFLPKVPQYETDVDSLQYLKSAFIKRVKLQTESSYAVSHKSCRSDQLDLFYQGHLQNRIDSWASSAWGQKIEYVYPLLDKRIVEFALGIPAHMYAHEGTRRFLFRYATKGILPEPIRWGNFKEEPARVGHLMGIEKETLKKIAQEIQQRDNPYIDFEKVLAAINNGILETDKTFSDETVFDVVRLEKAVSVFISSYLCYNKI